MGLLSEEESRDLTDLLKQNPALRQEVEEIEAAIMAAGSAYAHREPGADILENALAQIEAESREDQAGQTEQDEQDGAKVTDMFPEEKTGRSVWPTWISIAASVLLLASLGINAYLYRQWKHTDEALIALQVQSEQVLAESENLRTRLEASASVLAEANRAGSLTVRLEGLDLAPQSRAVISWNAQSGQIALMHVDLPAAASEFQYQLWAIIDGKPVDAGVLTLDGAQMMKRMEGQPAAFAITLEQAGGSPIPTLNRMYVYGALAG